MRNMIEKNIKSSSMLKILISILIVSQLSYSFLTIPQIRQQLEPVIAYLVKDPANFCPSFSPSIGFLGIPDELSFIALSGVAIFASFLISLFFYLMAKILDYPNAISILTVKMSDLAMLIAILLGFSAIYVLLYLPQDGLIRKYHDYAFEYNGKLISQMVYTYPILFMANSMYYAFYNYQLPLSVGRNNLFSFHLNIGPVFKPLIDVSTTISSYIGLVFGEFVGKQYFLCFVRVSLLPFLFPLGILLRAFNATKGAGAAIIGITIAFFTVYPAMLSLNYAIYDIKVLRYFDAGLSKSQSFETLLSIMGIATIVAVVAGGYKLYTLLRNYAIAGPIFLAKSAISVVLLALAFINLLFLIDIYLELIGVIIIYGFLLPAINIFITLNVAREISRFLSVDLDLSAFMRLI